MDAFSVYVPIDRLHALRRRLVLPDRAHGAVLFADISGFTPLTEGLARAFGPRRGAEELSVQLNHVYDALVPEAHRYGGSVLCFSGDALTCCFMGDDGWRALAAALAMQSAMGRFHTVTLPDGKTVSLGMKAAVASGGIRRFIVGDPEVQLLDVIAGAPLARMAEAEHFAERGEVVVDGDTARAVEDRIETGTWHTDPRPGRQVAVVKHLRSAPPETPWPELEAPPSAAELRPWLLPPVYERLLAGQGEFLTELRPATALFVRFGGIGYDGDDAAGAKLDAFLRHVQQVIARYDGTLTNLTIGDKGSYMLAALGAPVAHEDDPRRATAVALELRRPPAELPFITGLQVGLAQGTMRVGSYGGTQRRTYSVLGDQVNLAARLMQHAPEGEVLATRDLARATEASFEWEERAPIKVKGKTAPVAIARLVQMRRRAQIRSQEPQYALPMVGRVMELGRIADKLRLAATGRGQVVGIQAEAGMGKSRLVAEVVRLAAEDGWAGFGGECLSHGTNTSYLVWSGILREFFGVNPDVSLAEQTQELERRLVAVDPDLPLRLPLLGSVLGLELPDNDLTRPLDAKLRKSAVESLLVACLRHRARQVPLLLVLEDCHWLDPLSRDLIETMARALADLPVLLLLAYRPPDAGRNDGLRLGELPHFTEVPLVNFTAAEAGELIRLKLRQFFGGDAELPRQLVERFAARTEGNPFYLEELLNYLKDRGLNLRDVAALEHFELPSTLHSLILSRIDQLTEHQKTTLKLASVVGRAFEADMLWGAYPQLGTPEEIKQNLRGLQRLDLTPLDRPEPQLAYVFKHIVTQEVAYESLPFATREGLHDLIGQYLEQRPGEAVGVFLLAFHFDRSRNVAKKREYLLKAGAAAKRDYANAAAISYFERVLPVLAPEEKVPVRLQLGQVLELVGRWDDARKLYTDALAAAGQPLATAQCELALGDLCRKRGDYADATRWLQQARTCFEQLGDKAGLAQALHTAGTLSAQQGDYPVAQELYEASLALRRELDDRPRIASLLSNLGILAEFRSDFATQRRLCEESLRIRRELGDRWAIANSLNNLGMALYYAKEYAQARQVLEESVALNRVVGDRWAIANSLTSLGDVCLEQGDAPAAATALGESLTIQRDLGDRRAIAFLLESFGKLAAARQQADLALRLIGAAEALRQTTGAPLSPTEEAALNHALEAALPSLAPDRRATALQAGRELAPDAAIGLALSLQV